MTYRSRAGHTFVLDATSPPLASILCWFPVLDAGVAGLFYEYVISMSEVGAVTGIEVADVEASGDGGCVIEALVEAGEVGGNLNVEESGDGC